MLLILIILFINSINKTTYFFDKHFCFSILTELLILNLMNFEQGIF